MGSFSCKCGVVTRDGPIYNENSWVCLTLEQARELEASVAKQTAVQADVEAIEDIVAGEINERFRPMFRCPECGRVYLSKADGSNTWSAFVPDGEIPESGT